jgi:hypothetical protein
MPPAHLLRTTLAFVLLFACPHLIACNGKTDDLLPEGDAGSDGGSGSAPAADSGAGNSDAGEGPSDDDSSIPGCPGVPPIPTAPVYECQPTATSATGCPPWDANGGDAGVWYPIGCNMRLPSPQGGCAGACCGAQTCACQSDFPGSGPSFVCPM